MLPWLRKLAGEVDIRAVVELEADVAGHIVGLAAAVLVAAVAGLQIAALGVFLEDDVDHTADGVRAVLGGRAVGQYLDVVDGVGGNQVQVGAGAAAEVVGTGDVDVGGGMAALAVDQH